MFARCYMLSLVRHHGMLAFYVYSLCSLPCHAYLGAPQGVTLLEFALLEPAEPQKDPPQEGEVGEEDSPKCPNHHPTTFIVGKPRSILSLPIFLLSCSRVILPGYIY
jgi:hypothetical protein